MFTLNLSSIDRSNPLVANSLVLARAFLEAGVRGQIGKVAMDQNSIPSYIETTASSLADTESFIRQVRDLTAGLPEERRILEPVVTPRFAPTCSIELMRGLAALADKTGTRVQSHMCESRGMVDACREMFVGKSDVEVLDEVSPPPPPSHLRSACASASLWGVDP